ncbi:PAAR domain-containing protein [Pseudomonas sp. Pseusp122]|uniref:PAAR domain-containing protein n=1 Tax=unclassified Pseudomonas TaxID=196821 RepID=UPI0039A544C9
MIPVTRLGDKHVCPIPGHGTSTIVSASSDVQINDLGAARVGDVCGCGAVITAGYPRIIINHRPVAHLGSPTSHGGFIVSGSHDTFGGYQFEGECTETVIDFAKLGTVRPDGSVDEPLMAQLLADPQLKERALLSGALLQSEAAPQAAKEPLTPELIAVAGSQHDNGSGNKMMFIAQAVRELAEFRSDKPGLTRTLVVFAPSYNDAMLSAARASADHYDAAFITVGNAQELIHYLNQGKDRKQSPIEHLSLFSHGVPQRIAFGYQLAEDQELSLDVLNYEQLSALAFAGSAQIDSYACRTGMGNVHDLAIEGLFQFFSQTDESLAQLLADHLQIKVRAFIRRSDYKNTWGSFRDRQRSKSCEAKGSAVPHEKWCKWWRELATERYETDKSLRFTYQLVGAIHPVISGNTPVGASGEYFEFLPK